ncbi:MAG: molecular chaperone TorD family protein [Candidatus Omnitrophica bacterium]|nr:molecular chaperone TorD family protein [Candidatus Omnitrophota bacterium]
MADITAFYTAFGLRLDPLIHERADHITVECEFMHFLIYKEVYALEHDGEEKALLCRQAASRFLSEHLGRWMPAFSARLAKQAGGGILKEIAERALSFITEECQRLGIQPGPTNLPIRVIQHEQETDCGSCSLR